MPNAEKVRNLVGASIDAEARLSEKYSDVRSKYQINDHRTEILLKRYEKELRVLKNPDDPLPEVATISEEGKYPGPPETVTYEQVSRAKTAAEAFTRKARPEILRLLQRPGGKEILMELPAGAIDHLADAFSPVTKVFPAFKPILDTVKSTITDGVKLRLKRTLDAITQSAVAEPTDLEAVLPRAEEDIGNSVPSVYTARETSGVHEEIGALHRQQADIRSSLARLDSAAGNIEARARAQAESVRRTEPDMPVGNQVQEQPVERTFTPPLERGSELRAVPDSTPTMDPVDGQCICETYMNGALISSVPISVGAWCGPYHCGPR